MSQAIATAPRYAPVLSEFHDRATEQAFLRHQLTLTQAQLRMALLFCVGCYLAIAIVTDVAWLGYGQQTLAVIAARALVAAGALGCLLLLRRYPLSVCITRLVATVAGAAGAGGFLLVAATRPAIFQWHAVAMTIVIIVLYIYIPNRLLYAGAVALPATALFVLLAWQRSTLPAMEQATMAMLLLLANLFGYVAARRYQLLWRAEYHTQTVLKNLSVRDHLTGCYNRRHLHDQLLDKEIARARRYRRSLAVMLCDLDHFKQINDRYGHHGGDAVLQAFADVLLSMTRDGVDSVVRYGGEEFLLILPETDLDGGAQLAERLRATLAALAIPLPGQGHVSATASFGVVAADFAHAVQEATQNRMIASADELLYAAKNGGRNRVCSLPFPS